MKARDRKGLERAKKRAFKNCERAFIEERNYIYRKAQKELIANAKACNVIVRENKTLHDIIPKQDYIRHRNSDIACQLADCLLREGLISIEEDYDPITNTVLTRASVKLFYDPYSKVLGKYKPSIDCYY